MGEPHKEACKSSNDTLIVLLNRNFDKENVIYLDKILRLFYEKYHIVKDERPVKFFIF